MQIYLVGGAVRDELLGKPVKERDWVVVDATPEEMIALGFQPVGKEFPVFLHPETHEEYALARTERKVSKGYKGFTFYAATDVTLEEDLKRRDLTINAMARSPTGELIDPYGGLQDLRNKLLRHVSPAFSEDPVRILRVARFATKMSDFRIAPETNTLMQKMVENGEVDALVSERVWQEFERALQEEKPVRFFEVLAGCQALKKLFPEIDMKGNGIKALIKATKITSSSVVRFAALLCDLTEISVKNFCQRLRTSGVYQDLAFLVVHWLPVYQSITHQPPMTILQLLKSVDGFRRPERFQQFLFACEASTFEKNKIHSNLLNKILHAVKSIDIKPLVEKKLEGKEFANELHRLQIKIIMKLL